MQDFEFRQLIERVKLRSPIEIVVGERVRDLRQRGSLFWARCPFHEERTPSFAVDPRRGTWHCYGACGEGGDVFSFVQRFDGATFVEALRLLAQACGEEVPEARLGRPDGRGGDDRRDALQDVLERARRLYARGLDQPPGDAARDYLRARGFRDETVRQFGLGWSPETGNPLCEAARAGQVSLDLLAEAGLVKRADDGRPFDFFRGRLMIPIEDRLGRIVGFGARTLQAEARVAKYVNTPETPLFHKGRLVYGLARAHRAVRRSRHLVLVEGYTDVMAAHQAGIEHVAAVLGTATTPDHAALIRRSGARRVSLIFDGDEAGRKASRRALLGLLPAGLTLDVVELPAGQDPCDVLLRDGAAGFETLVQGARDWFDWTVDGLQGLRGAELAQAVDELFELLLPLEKPVEREARLTEAARRLGVPEDGIRLQWTQFRRRAEEGEARSRLGSAGPRGDGGRDGRGSRAADGPREAGVKEVEAFRALLGALLLDNSLIPLYAPLVDTCPEGDLRLLYRTVLELYERDEDESDPIDAPALIGALGDHPARDQVVPLEELARTAESPMFLAEAQARWLERARRERALLESKGRLAQSQRSLEGGDSVDDLLTHLHRELRRGRVPDAASSPRVPS